ncbi:MAG TPA: hypothetical protein VFA56_10195 [Gaiellaceae bacterium]|nr:hypothetical protein [Gaiellaceae bacterium]
MDLELAAVNAAALDRALVRSRRSLTGLETDDERQRRADALLHIEGYTALLRQPTTLSMHPAARYSFKLVFPDGRWSIDEKQLPARPAEGDVVVFAGTGGWRVEGHQHVSVRPAGKPPREFFVCAPVA